MDVITLIAQFGGVFAAAFLAFLLENVRERRRTTRWVKEHLGHMREGLVSNVSDDHKAQAKGVLSDQLAALDAWLEASDSAELSDEQWSVAAMPNISEAPDLSAVLRSEAVVTIPQDLARALAKLEEAMVTAGRNGDLFQEALRDVLPAWHDRQAPLSYANASRVGRFRRHVTLVQDFLPEMFGALEDVVVAIDRWR